MKFSIAGIRARYPETDRVGQIYLLEEQRLAYVGNPRVASSSLKLMFERMHRGDESHYARNVHNRRNRSVPRPQDLGRDRVQSLGEAGLFGFTFVRDPVPRALSVYADKVARLPAFRAMANEALGRASERDVSFDDFLCALEAQPAHEMNAHWRPQHMVLMMDALDYDFVGKLESFRADLATVWEMTGLPPRDPPPGRTRHEHPRPVPTETQRRRLRAVYAEDFERLGY